MMDIRLQEISMQVPQRWISSITQAVHSFNQCQRVRLNNAMIDCSTLKLCAGDVSSFLGYLTTTISEFEKHQIKAILMAAVLRKGAAKRSVHARSFYELAYAAAKNSKVSLRQIVTSDLEEIQTISLIN